MTLTSIRHAAIPRIRRVVGPRRRTVALAVAVLAATASGTVAFSANQGHDVRVAVDGQTRTVHTSADTVRGVLASAHLRVGAHDIVAPTLDAKVAAADGIVLRHGRAIRLTVGTTTRVVWVTATSVQQALGQLGLAQTGEYVSASRSRPIGLDGIALDVRLPQTLTVVHDGTLSLVSTSAATIADALAAGGLTLGAADRLSVPGTAYPTSGMTVKITRVKNGQLSSDDVIVPTVRRVPDGGLYTGQSRVVDSGQDGIVHNTYAVTYADGKLVGQKLVTRTPTQAMRPEVVHYGTAARPAYNAGNTGGLNWGALADCESGGNPHAVSGNGEYYGLYQFSLSTWRSVGGSGRPSDASSSEQTSRAERLYASAGRSAWPVCGQYL